MATKRQKKFVKIVKENLRKPGKKPTLGQIAREAGYSDSVSNHPKENITETKGMKELLTELVPEKEAAKIHAGLMKMETLDSFTFSLQDDDNNIKKIVVKLGCRLLSIGVIPIIGKKIAYFAVPNGKIRKEGLELYYKVKGSLAPERLRVTDDIDDLPEDDLDDKLRETDPLAARYKKYSKVKKTKKSEKI
ncbi:MAG: hypothetical protein COY66_05830 [Candidatus Kerfeldbacteria bacterium CG_4_10_14_0_8_um_filter_42_10]|uniref:Uncharacterized protein n=1 Tax=Candidatus Kerfeldbacteria bacterium CG_4_10_14_0_8_um_filter_42_10 TaxID=2014248 RepID=A0A2M7RGD7_9BACT|nr:MAG: hypothetical protein COY66_05830 [Candidatus Kerfeldbacteria bacterium CG_4_10_14_0_8_um_filter_42_10]